MSLMVDKPGPCTWALFTGGFVHHKDDVLKNLGSIPIRFQWICCRVMMSTLGLGIVLNMLAYAS